MEYDLSAHFHDQDFLHTKYSTYSNSTLAYGDGEAFAPRVYSRQEFMNKSDEFKSSAPLSHRRHLLTKNKRPSSISNECVLDQLPSDLSSKSGSIEKFGGPQHEQDGSIEFYGASFAVPTKDGEFKTQVYAS